MPFVNANGFIYIDRIVSMACQVSQNLFKFCWIFDILPFKMTFRRKDSKPNKSNLSIFQTYGLVSFIRNSSDLGWFVLIPKKCRHSSNFRPNFKFVNLSICISISVEWQYHRDSFVTWNFLFISIITLSMQTNKVTPSHERTKFSSAKR